MERAVGGTCHVIFHVTDAARTTRFWQSLGFVVVYEIGPEAVFLRAPGSDQPFDVGLMEAGDEAAPPAVAPRRGVYHAGWSVVSLDELMALKADLEERDLVIGSADHGTHVSVYAVDPDDNEVEFCWLRPREAWPSEGLTVRPLVSGNEVEQPPEVDSR